MAPEQLVVFGQAETVPDDGHLWQERYVGDTWKHMVTCVMLNRTTIKQVSRVIDEFFVRYPTPYSYAEHIKRFNGRPMIVSFLKPLGMSERRTETLLNLAMALLTSHGKSVIETLKTVPGLGKYAIDSYRLVELGDMTTEPTDKKLLKWKNARVRQERH